MYTRHFGRKNLKIPEDYCGNAFEKDENDCTDEKDVNAPREEKPNISYSQEKDEGCDDKMQSLFEKIGLDRVATPDLLIVLLAFLLMSERSTDSELPLILLLLLILSD